MRRSLALLVMLATTLVGLLAVMELTSRPAKAAVPINVGDVLAAVGNGLVDHYSNTGTLLETLDTTTASANTAGMCFDPNANLYVSSFQANKVSTFNSSGTLLQASFGTGYNSHPESCTIDAAGQVYVGQADGTHQILKFDSAGNPLATYSPAVESRGTDWVDLASDQCTIYYTSEGTSIKRFNVCTNTQLADFATGLLGTNCYAHRLRANGEVMVACTDRVVRLSPTGTVLQTYLASTYQGGTSVFFGLNLDPDGTTFWTGDLNTFHIYRINIATGAQVTTWTAAGVNNLGGLTVRGEQVQSQPSPSPTPTQVAVATATPTAAPVLPKAGGSGPSPGVAWWALGLFAGMAAALVSATVLTGARRRK